METRFIQAGWKSGLDDNFKFADENYKYGSIQSETELIITVPRSITKRISGPDITAYLHKM